MITPQIRSEYKRVKKFYLDNAMQVVAAAMMDRELDPELQMALDRMNELTALYPELEGKKNLK